MKDIIKSGVKTFVTAVGVVTGIAVGCVAGESICVRFRSNKKSNDVEAENVKAE